MAEPLALDADLNRFYAEDLTTTAFEKKQLLDLCSLLEVLSQVMVALRQEAETIARMDVEHAFAAMDENQQTGLVNLAAVIERWRGQLVTDAAKIQALQASQEFYARYVRLLADLDLPEQALGVSEAARARAFLDLVRAGANTTGESADQMAGGDAAILSLAAAPAPAVGDIKRIIQAHGGPVIEYLIAEDALFIWVIDPAGSVQMRRVPVGRAALLELVQRTTALLDNRDPVTNAARPPQDALEAEHSLPSVLETLHADLIQPIAALLPADGVLTVIPHDFLFRVPFAALRTPTGRFLVEEYALAYAPSIAALDMVHRLQALPARSEPVRLLAFVNPTLGRAMVDTVGQPFPPLNESEAVVEGIARNFYAASTTRVLRGSAATRAEFLSTPPGSADVALFATHAEAQEANPLASYIALADGRLTTRDLAGSRLHASLAILAACETGRGPTTGDGVNGLSRFFLTGGTPTLLTSLWKVPELATGLQIGMFHQAWLVDGASKAEALRAAQREAMRAYPYSIRAWAGFVLIGGWR
jgi:CHAT domain-containing protein